MPASKSADLFGDCRFRRVVGYSIGVAATSRNGDDVIVLQFFLAATLNAFSLVTLPDVQSDIMRYSFADHTFGALRAVMGLNLMLNAVQFLLLFQSDVLNTKSQLFLWNHVRILYTKYLVLAYPQFGVGLWHTPGLQFKRYLCLRVLAQHKLRTIIFKYVQPKNLGL